MIIDYTILVTPSPEDLTRRVCQHIAEGWQPIGGVAAYSQVDTEPGSGLPYVTSEPRFCQAMTKERA